MPKFKFNKGADTKKEAQVLEVLATCDADGVEYELCADSYKSGKSTNHVLVLRAPGTGIKDSRIGAPKFCALAQMLDQGLAHLAKVTPDLVGLNEEEEEDVDPLIQELEENLSDEAREQLEKLAEKAEHEDAMADLKGDGSDAPQTAENAGEHD